MKRDGVHWLLLIVPAFLILSCRALAPAPAVPGPAVQLPIQTAPLPQLPPNADLAELEDTLIQIYEQVSPGVVSLDVVTQDGTTQGSGFVFDRLGHVVTNYHVVMDVETLEVSFASGLKARAELLGVDADSDLAVIKVEVSEEALHPLRLSESDQIKVGQSVIAIGNPFGFRGTMTLGIVSGLGRSMRSLHAAPGGGIFSAGDFIQTDAAINPGNSGGPLLNLRGEVIGVNRAIFTNSFTADGDPVNTGIGFAVSVNIVKRVVPALISQGHFDYPYIGINSVDELTLDDLDLLGLPYTSGVYINRVTPGSPADKAGLIGGSRRTDRADLQAGGDLIIAIDKQNVLTFDEFISYLVRFKSPGDPVVLTIVRNSQQMDIQVTLDKRPSP